MKKRIVVYQGQIAVSMHHSQTGETEMRRGSIGRHWGFYKSDKDRLYRLVHLQSGLTVRSATTRTDPLMRKYHKIAEANFPTDSATIIRLKVAGMAFRALFNARPQPNDLPLETCLHEVRKRIEWTTHEKGCPECGLHEAGCICAAALLTAPAGTPSAEE